MHLRGLLNHCLHNLRWVLSPECGVDYTLQVTCCVTLKLKGSSVARYLVIGNSLRLAKARWGAFVYFGGYSRDIVFAGCDDKAVFTKDGDTPGMA